MKKYRKNKFHGETHETKFNNFVNSYKTDLTNTCDENYFFKINKFIKDNIKMNY